MEAAIRGLLESSFGDYVEGLDRASAGSFPMTLKDLKIKEAAVQEELDEDGNFPFDLSSGRIGQITVSPGWMGTVEVVATGIVLNFSFSPMKAMNNAFKKEEPDDEEEQHTGVPHAPPPYPGVPMQQGPPPADVPPRFCQNHFTSAQREKIDPCQRPCERCGAQITSTYAHMTFCPPCSNEVESCMICGGHAPVASNYIPPKTLGNNPPQGGMVFAKPIEPDVPDAGRPPVPRSRQGRGEAGLPSPPPPPPMGAAARLGDFDLDWALGGSSPKWGQAPPSPPPPPSNRAMQTSQRAGAPRAGAQPPPMSSGQGGQFHEQAPRMPPTPQGDPMRSQKQRPQAHFAPSDERGAGTVQKVGGWQGMYSSATDRLDQMLDYLGNLSLPGMDMNQWSTCMNSGDQHDSSEFREVTRSPDRRQPRHAQVQHG